MSISNDFLGISVVFEFCFIIYDIRPFFFWNTIFNSGIFYGDHVVKLFFLAEFYFIFALVAATGNFNW